MSQGYLTDSQQAALKAARARAWTRTFTVEKANQTPGPDYYDVPTSAPTTTDLKGDWDWRQHSERRGSEGGEMDRADLILATDILNKPVLSEPDIRIVVEGIRCSITSFSPYSDTGELVLSAVRV
jgi:hypothetical protein